MNSGQPSKAELMAIRLLVFDFDGVFTDNAVWVDAAGLESVRCWRSDGLGLARLRRMGLEMMVLSTEKNPVVATRCAKLQIPCEHGVEDKATRLASIVQAKGLDWKFVAFVGNDTNDLGCLHSVGLPIAVADADPRILKACRWVTNRAGGFGAVREVCDVFADAREVVPSTIDTSQ
jgi:YrbI family 3-deoxy-D-manno-octulosonate 8-phosphate phosphatase